MDSVIFSRIKVLCAENGITITKLESLMGMSQSTIGKWRTATPTVDKLLRVAQYFNVSFDYLTGISTMRETAECIVKDSRLQNIITMWERFSEHEKNRIEIMMMMSIDHDKFDADFTKRLTKLISSYEGEESDNGKPEAEDN